MAAVGAAPEDREMVTDQSPATSGEDGRPVGEACPLLLAFSGGRASEPAADPMAALAGGIITR